MDPEQERQLVEQAKKDPQAFGQLFDQYYLKIYSYILKRTGDVALSQDLTSETFFKALKKLWQFKWRGISFSAWLYRIATNEIAAYYRGKLSKNVSLEQLMDTSHFDVEDQHSVEQEVLQAQDGLDREQQYQILRKHLAQLSDTYQQVLSLRFFEQKKINEIAIILNKKEGTVKSLLSRGVAQLRESSARDVQPFSTARIVEVEVEKHN